MFHVKHLNKSPLDNSELIQFLSCKDYTVSQKEFTIWKDSRNDFLVTTPRPTEKELHKYYESAAYISHTDSSRSLVDKAYQLVRYFTLRRKLNLINSFKLDKKSILDVGAGTGDFLRLCQRKGWHIDGVEPNLQAKRIAEDKLSHTIQERITDLKATQYNVITLWHVLEHIPDLIETMQRLKELLKPEGRLVIAVPNHKSFDANHYKEYWAAYDVPRHFWHFSQVAMRTLVSKTDMIIEQTHPMKFDAYYVSLLSEKYKSGSMNLVRAYITGLRSNLKARRSNEYSSLIYIIKKNEKAK